MSTTEQSAQLPLQLLPPTGSRIAIVGACGGMGQALVSAALQGGLRVAALDLQRSLEQSPPPVQTLALPCDVSDEASVASAFARIAETWGGLDTLVNLAGYSGDPYLVRDLDVKEWDAINDCCVRGAFLAARAALPLLDQGENPSIVLISSTFGHRVSYPGCSAYAAAKAGVVSLGKALATECAPRTRVNVVSPGVFRTAFLDGGMSRPKRDSGIDFDKYPQTVPLKRLGQPSEIVGPILFLASPAASYITGQVLHVNGGIWAP